ncbi:MAG: hypothetical protein KJ726_09530 [Verrucomicrobia bacterium]|nr:hypothetical protein [Verrucomicrobiota bacterium]MBU1910275.1 hypothetical protein [Verrucomicrobiota bacterium]
MNALFALMLTGLMLFSTVGLLNAPVPPEIAESVEPAAAETPVSEATLQAVAEETMPSVEVAPEPQAAMPSATQTFAVFLPERIERVWFWYAYTEEIQHIVQSAVEKALLNAGLQVVDVSSMTLPEQGDLNQVMSPQQVVRWGAAAGASYIIMGTATADPQSEGTAYGQRVVRATANISARIIRVSDSRIMSVQDATALMGGQALPAASREALKKAGEDIGRKLARAAKSLTAP